MYVLDFCAKTVNQGITIHTVGGDHAMNIIIVPDKMHITFYGNTFVLTNFFISAFNSEISPFLVAISLSLVVSLISCR